MCSSCHLSFEQIDYYAQTRFPTLFFVTIDDLSKSLSFTSSILSISSSLRICHNSLVCISFQENNYSSPLLIRSSSNDRWLNIPVLGVICHCYIEPMSANPSTSSRKKSDRNRLQVFPSRWLKQYLSANTRSFAFQSTLHQYFISIDWLHCMILNTNIWMHINFVNSLHLPL